MSPAPFSTPTPSRPKIIVVDDHEGIRDIVKTILEGMGHSVFLECTDGQQAMKSIIEHQPDLVVIDLILPEINGLEVVRQARDLAFAGRFVVLTSQMQPYVLRRIHEMRIEGAISKLAGLATWREGLKAVISSKPYRCACISLALTSALTDPDCPSRRLTDRETEILALIGEALTNSEIAECLGMSPHTVQGVRSKLLHKLNLTGTPNLVKFAHEHGYTAFHPSISLRQSKPSIA